MKKMKNEEKMIVVFVFVFMIITLLEFYIPISIDWWIVVIPISILLFLIFIIKHQYHQLEKIRKRLLLENEFLELLNKRDEMIKENQERLILLFQELIKDEEIINLIDKPLFMINKYKLCETISNKLYENIIDYLNSSEEVKNEII